MNNFLLNITNLFFILITSAVIILLVGSLIVIFGYLWIIWHRNKEREKKSLDSTLLQIALPRENEIKIDAAEQLFAALAGIKPSGRLSFLKYRYPISFEIVGMPGDIRFYIYTPNKYRDMIEKQINASYPDAEIKVAEEGNVKGTRPGFILGNEYNIFSKEGFVAFKQLKLKDSNYKSIRVYKDLAVDPLSSLTSVLSKMSEGEGAAIQILISGADSKWSKLGRSHIAETKKRESNPETAKYSSDPKELEGIEGKISKPGFYSVVRLVVSSTSKEAAEAHLNNLDAAFDQFSGSNSFTKTRIWMKGTFITDFVYRYFPMRGSLSVLTSEELATIFHFPNKAVATPHI